jgi:four helix bundle protein
MFPFETLTVYQKAKVFHHHVAKYLRKSGKVDRITHNQLKRAALSVPLDVAEGSGRFTKPDQRHFYVIARSSIFECVAILDILQEEGNIDKEEHQQLYALADELSRMLYTMRENLKGK